MPNIQYLLSRGFRFQHKPGISVQIDHRGVLKKIQQKIKLPAVGIELTTPTIKGLEGQCLTHSANLSFLASLRF